MSQLDATCPKCGGPMYRYAKTCAACKGHRGAANHMYGQTHTPEAREKIRAAALARVQQPRKKRSTTAAAGRVFARKWIPLEGDCERCRAVPAVDRHHIDGDPQNNDRSNIALLCRRCHQEVDGRMAWLTAPGVVGSKGRLRP